MELIHLFRSHKILTLAEIKDHLGGISNPTAFRYLKHIPYRTSYNRNGRYYTLHDETKYDSLGLWAHEGVRFSRDGTLTASVSRLVQESPAGYTQRELQEVLSVRVQNILQTLLERSEIRRELVGSVYVYFHPRPDLQGSQKERRLKTVHEKTDAPISNEGIIDILLAVIRHPGSNPAGISRRLRGRCPPIRVKQVRWVLDRYGIDPQKGGSRP